MRLFKDGGRLVCGLLSIGIVFCLAGCTLPKFEKRVSKPALLGSIGYQSEITLRYQYAKLSEKEKELYTQVLAALSNGDRFVDTAEFAMSAEVCKKILNAVLCDSPDLFWVSRNFLIEYEGPVATTVYFRYFDGEQLDDYELSKNGELIFTEQADQLHIRVRIAQFEEKAASVLANLRHTSALETEVAIHDFVAETVTYNDAAAESVTVKSGKDTARYFDQFTAYGALVHCSAVCEGYAKLFQYLCLLQGINCTQVSGTAEGEGHMWNAVSLVDGWYFVDVTFDDVGKEEIPLIYTYLNVDAAKLQRTHTVSTEELLSVPPCDSMQLNYCTNELINITGGQITADYVDKIKEKIAEGASYILIYFPDAQYDDAVLERVLYYMPHSLEECIERYGSAIEKVMTIEPDYAIVFLEN